MENIISGSLAGLIAGILFILIQLYLDNKRIQRESIKGIRKKGILDKNFLLHHSPRKITLEIVLNYFGGPTDVEGLTDGEKVYKYEFENGILKLLVESNDHSISGISFWYAGKYPVKCPNYLSKSHSFFGKATFTKKLIDKGIDFWTYDKPRIGYSSISCNFDGVELSRLKFTYFILETFPQKEDLLYLPISQVAISHIWAKSEIFIHYDEIEDFYINYE